MVNPDNFVRQGCETSHEQKMHRQRQKPEPDQEHLGEVQRLRAGGFTCFVFGSRKIHAIFQKHRDARNNPDQNEQQDQQFDQYIHNQG